MNLPAGMDLGLVVKPNEWGLPVGMIQLYRSELIDEYDWLERPDGRLVRKDDYPELYNVLQLAEVDYGHTDTEFNFPSLYGKLVE